MAEQEGPGVQHEDRVPQTGSNQDLLDKLKRERADFVNYRRRVAADRAGDRDLGRADVLTDLLPVLDDLDRALSQVPPELEKHPWAQGIMLSHRRLLQTLEEMGFRRVGEAGDVFDPALHEAVSFEADENFDKQRVSTVSQPGYAVGARLLRPARVSVQGPSNSTGQPSTTDNNQ